MSDPLPSPANELVRGIVIALANNHLDEASRIVQTCAIAAHLFELAAFDLAQRGFPVPAGRLIGLAYEANKILEELEFSPKKVIQ